jgi:asparagine synthase (glutamine-hydrolysing)
LLSGGLDSSLLLSLAAERICQNGTPRPKAFSVIYESPAMSEWPYIQLVLARQRLQGANVVLSPERVWGSVPEVVRALGQPLLGQDMIAQYHAYGLAREQGRTVVLDGQGADEVLGGLPLYESEFLLGLARTAQFRRLARELRARSRKYGDGFLANAQMYLAKPLRRRVQTAMGLPRYGWIAPASKAEDANPPPGRGGDDPFPGLNGFLHQLVRRTNLPTVLQQQDRSSMAHAVESRVPYLDHRLVEFCFRLPDDYKIRLGDRKRILLETARKYLPAGVVQRKDKRALISDSHWLDLREHASELRALARSPAIQRSPLFFGEKTTRFVDDFLRGQHDDFKAAWRIYTAEAWLQAFGQG